ncbi:SDR family oxidoreductase [Mycolicibacterium sp. P1-18]|uniref:SDR family oxidoreductase n=1 Tax=Mycolicibacterium sp. P1-18 TaxID=2024615 RepID=UPI0011F151BF|nr:SDR family oxidoreductase [Mycolicibacterium sp. P1-18]KAA0096912.1 SDR family oxidoreductase [Mycolicibacterium sp. P1-18]
MGTYAVTGSASGMGRAASERLRANGHRVIGVDLHDAEIVADLSTAAGRARATSAVLEAAANRLDGAVFAAGVGPTPGPDRPRLVLETNYLGVVEVASGWRAALAATGNAKVVVVGSNSATTVPMVPRRAVRALLAGDLDAALRSLRPFRRAAPAMAYAASKIAVSRWVRRQAVTSQWAGRGIRINALAPGAVMTPLLQKQLATPREAKAIRGFPVPIGGYGDPERLAEWIVFMLSDAADFLCGSVVFVDGGSDAYFRSDNWPAAPTWLQTPRYLWQFRRFRTRD